MKFLVILCLAVIATAFAEDTVVPAFTCTGNDFVCKLKELGHNIKFHATNLGGKLKDVGTSILSAALDQGKNLLENGGKAVLGTVMEHLNKSGILGKRAISDLFDKVKEHMGKGKEFLAKVKEGLKAKFEAAVKKITGVMANTASLKMVKEDAAKKIDEAVAQFKKEGKTGFLQMAAAIKNKLKDIFTEGMNKLKAMAAKKDEKRGIRDWWNNARGRFSNLVGGLSDTLKPHLDALKSGLQGLADKAKEHGSNLLTSAKGQFDALKGKISGHLDTLKGQAAKLGDHAKNAVNELKEAVTAIVNKTVKDAAGVLNA